MTVLETIQKRLAVSRDHGCYITGEERSQLDHVLQGLLAAIAEASSLDRAQEKLSELARLQDVLAVLCYKFKLELSELQYKLVYVYDRHDLPEVRHESYEAIRKGCFL